MAHGLVLVLLIAAQAPPTPADSARAVVEGALAAVEAGSGRDAAAAAARRAGSGNPLDQLRLAVLRVQLYQDDAAEPDLRALAAETGSVAVQAALALAGSHQRRGRVPEARKMFERAAQLAAAGMDTVALAEAELALAAFDIRSGAPDRAAERIARADLLAGAATPALRARVHCQRSALLSFTGQPGGVDEAERGAVLALEAGRGRLAGQCLLSIGASWIQRGELALGGQALERADSLLRSTRDDAALAAVLQWRGYGLRQLLRFGEAHTVLHEALALAQQSGAASAGAWTRLNLASIAAALGDFEGARNQLTVAAADFDRQDDQWGRHSALILLSSMLRRLGALDSADAVARGVEAWGRRASAPASISGAIVERSVIATVRGDWPAVRERIDSLDALYVRLGWTVWRASLVRDRAAVALASGDLATAGQLLATHLRGLRYNQPLLRYAVRVRVAEIEVRSGRLDSAVRELAAAGDELDAARRSLPVTQWRQLAVQAGSAVNPDLRVASLIAAIAPAMPETAFDLAEARRARELRDRLIRASTLLSGPDTTRAGISAPRSLRQFQAALRETSASALVYVTGQGDEPTTLFVVSADSVAVLALSPIDSLAPLIGRVTAALESGATAEGLLRELYTRLVAPAITRFGAVPDRLVIVPEGALYQVPFGALVDADGRPLLARTAVTLSPAATLFAEVRGRAPSPARRGVLAVADPPPHPSAGFDAGGLPELFASRGALGRLPGARREARRVVRYAADSRALIGRQATESALDNADPASYRVLHFASHALTDGLSPLRAAIALAPGSPGDGFLTAAELANLRLAADLVVLSSCRSAGGAVLMGEGLQGLTWPLLAAGARSVVASLWDVDDAATARLMADFYDEMAAGRTVADALAQTQRRAADAGAPASVWAAFTVIGDPLAAPALTEPGVDWRWPVALTLLAAVAVWPAFTWARRRRSGQR